MQGRGCIHSRRSLSGPQPLPRCLARRGGASGEEHPLPNGYLG